MLQLLPYLGGSKFLFLIESTKKYRAAPEEGAFEVDEDIALLNQNEGSQDSDGHGHGNDDSDDEKKIESSMEHLNDTLAIKLIVRIVLLMEYFCRQAIQNTSNGLFL